MVGDSAVGKSCLIHNYLHNAFNDDYEPTVLDAYRNDKKINNELVDVEIHDTAGDDHVAEKRKVVYKDTDLFLLCCSTVDETSLSNIQKWKTEIRGQVQDAPIVLISTKKDLREVGEYKDKVVST